MHAASVAAAFHLTLAYFVINIDPILVRIGPIAIHWYGLMYVVAISAGLWVTLRFTRRMGIHDEQVWGLFVSSLIWSAITCCSPCTSSPCGTAAWPSLAQSSRAR